MVGKKAIVSRPVSEVSKSVDVLLSGLLDSAVGSCC